MNPSRIAAHVAGSVVASGLWEVAVHIAPGEPTLPVVAAGLLPQVVVGISLAVQHAADRHVGEPGIVPADIPTARQPARHPVEVSQ